MKLAADEDVLARVGLSENTGSATTASAALKAATPQIERTIRTEFRRALFTEWFGGKVLSVSGDIANPEYIFNLARGFLDRGQRVKVYYSTSREPVLKTGDNNVALLPETDFEIDFTRGRVRLYTDEPQFFGGRRRIAIRYTAGFTASDDDSEMYADVPDDLREAAITQAVLAMRVGNIHRKTEGGAGRPPDSGLRSLGRLRAHLHAGRMGRTYRATVMAITGGAKVRGSFLLRAKLLALGLAVRTFGKDEDLKDLVVKRTKQRFDKTGKEAKRSPDGVPWAPLTTSGRWHTLRGNKDRSDILRDSGALRDAITVTRQNLGPAVVNTGSGFRVGVEGEPARYAGVHQRGGRSNIGGHRIPARPFLGVSGGDVKAVQKLALGKFSRAAKGAG